MGPVFSSYSLRLNLLNCMSKCEVCLMCMSVNTNGLIAVILRKCWYYKLSYTYAYA